MGVSTSSLAAAEILSRKRALPARDKGHIFGEDRIIERFFGRSPKKTSGIAAPEGLVLNNNHKFTAFEVKNQNAPDIDHTIRKFNDLFRNDNFSSSLSSTAVSKRKQLIGRLDLFIPSGTKGGAEGLLKSPYSINNNGLLSETVNGVEKTIRIGPNQLPVHVIRRDLPVKL
jgi:hypothetical protein